MLIKLYFTLFFLINLSMAENIRILNKDCRLLFIGDSITDMGRNRQEKPRDQNHVLGHSYVFNIAARLGFEYPELNLKFINRGISGNSVGDLRNRWQKDAVNQKPDILTILIGVNNLFKLKELPDFENNYRHILHQSKKANPNLKIVMLEPFLLPMNNKADEPDFIAKKKIIQQLQKKVAKLAEEFEAIYVKTQKSFDEKSKDTGPEYWLWDGVHPLPQGHELLSQLWLKAVLGRSH